MAVYQTRPFQRGDVYYVTYNNAIGSEQSMGRPGIIVTSEEGCKSNPVLSVVYLTTSEQHARISTTNVEINSSRKKSWAICNQVTPVDRSRLRDYHCTINKAEMAAVDKAIAFSLGIPYGIVEDTSALDHFEREKAELHKQLEQQKQEIERLRSLDVTVERDYYKSLYEVALRRFVDKRLDQDLVEQKPKVVPKLVPDEPEEKELVDLNSCTVADLKRCGMKEDVILRVIAARPFKKAEDLRYVQGVTKLAWQLLKDRVTVLQPDPVKQKSESGKLNLNTATAKEITDKIGMSACMAYSVTGYRNKHGNFKSVDELLNVPRFSKTRLENIRDKVCV